MIHDETKKITSQSSGKDFFNWELEQNYSSHCHSGPLVPMEIDLHTLCVSRQLTVAATVENVVSFALFKVI